MTAGGDSVVAAASQLLNDRAADEARATGDHHAHPPRIDGRAWFTGDVLYPYGLTAVDTTAPSFSTAIAIDYNDGSAFGRRPTAAGRKRSCACARRSVTATPLQP